MGRRGSIFSIVRNRRNVAHEDRIRTPLDTYGSYGAHVRESTNPQHFIRRWYIFPARRIRAELLKPHVVDASLKILYNRDAGAKFACRFYAQKMRQMRIACAPNGTPADRTWRMGRRRFPNITSGRGSFRARKAKVKPLRPTWRGFL